MPDATFYPCHIDAPHLPHDWTPLVSDPDTPQVLHLGLATLPCRGVTTKEWLARKAAEETPHPM